MHLKTLVLALFLLAPIALGSADAASPTVSVSMDQATYSVVSTMVDGVAPIATVTVLDANGLPAASTQVSVTFLRQVQLVGFVSSETVTGVTDANGVVSVAAPQLSGAPGHYLVAAFALGSAGSTSYDVGA